MKRNVIEWAVLLASLASIVALVGFLVVAGLSPLQPANPQVHLITEHARQGDLGWIVPARVANGGDEPAEAVVLEASAEIAGMIEVSSIEVDFLPAGTELEVAFSFSRRPDGAISVRLVGYRVP